MQLIEPRPPRVLVAEDDVPTRTLVAQALRDSGYEVTEAVDGADALDQVGTSLLTDDPDPPDVVVADARMPTLTGLQVLASMRHLGTPVVLMTASGDDESHALARRLGAASVVAKPIDIDELCGVVDELAMPRRADADLEALVHDLKNPLSVSASPTNVEVDLLDALLDTPSPAARQALARTRDNVRFVHRLVNDLLDLVRPQLSIERTPTELAGLLEVVVDRAVSSRDRDRVQLEIRDQITVMADERRIQRVVANLIDNAIRHAPRDSSVTIRLDGQGGVAVISVIDSGHLDAAEAERLFDHYRRATTRTSGSGLGLHISKRIVDAHGGRMGADTEPGRTRFFFELPRLIDASPRRIRQAYGRRVLLVDDDADQITALAELLRLEGFVTATATNPNVALAHVEHRRPDAVVVDIRMAGRSGVELVPQMREYWPKLPVVLTSGLPADCAAVRAALAATGARYLEKPIEVPRLVAMIDEMCVSAAGLRAR